jgi:hypothetical protein
VKRSAAILTSAASGFVLLAAGATAGAAVAGPVVSAQAAPAKLPVITTFTRNHFPESLAIDGQGNLYASLDYIGQVVKVTPGGQQQLVPDRSGL